MSRRNTSPNKFIFHELDESLAAQLRDATSECAPRFYSARSTTECLALAERFHADVVFCGSEPAEYRALLDALKQRGIHRSEEHTSELQSPMYLVCRLL